MNLVKQLTAHVKKHLLVWYYIISVLIVILIIPVFLLTGADVAVDQALQRTGIQFNTDLVTAFRVVSAEPGAFFGVLLAILQVAAPDIAVFIVASITYGRKGLLELKNRFRFWQLGMNWQYALKIWVICILVFSLMNLASAGLNKWLLPEKDFVWDINFFSIHFWLGLIIAMFLDAGGLFEENGWRGFALPILQKRFRPVQASIILGFFWSMWHIPVKINLLFDYGVINFLSMFFILTCKFILISILITYFFNLLGQSTIIAIAMHGLSNDSVRVGGKVLSETFIAQQITEINLVLPMFAVSMFLIQRTKGKLGLVI
ncbi:CPBP family intramembrane metalloprotease [Tolypothrix sp. FACHB-123]|uniref:CPBP family intramembrane glutamic endopeptidase n=1 Tax=Tolypothrix sp. FACHB-123 TaxID=2692868 RepID=UPI0016822CF3|nr:CPBP family intramembrane glutamic endopeptidase [Tolypothrix sp. FACHB-123]MBD2357993.1 CPBP family intramembrane metalloprotease [Tolypothrix sp. FACHB-123]